MIDLKKMEIVEYRRQALTTAGATMRPQKSACGDEQAKEEEEDCFRGDFLWGLSKWR